MKKLAFLTVIALFFIAPLCRPQEIIWSKKWETRTLEFSPQNDYIIVGLTKLNIQTGDSIGRFFENLNENPFSISLSSDGRWLAGGSGSGRIFVWNTITYHENVIEELGDPDGSSRNAIFDLEFSSDGSILAVAAREYGLLLYETNNWKRIKNVKWIIDDPKYGKKSLPVENVSFSHDNKTIAVSRNGWSNLAWPNICLYDIAKDTITILQENATLAQFSKTKNELYSLLYDEEPLTYGIYKYNFDSSSNPTLLPILCTDFKISNDGEFLIDCGAGPIIELYYIKFMEKRFYHHGYNIYHAIINSNDRYLCGNTGNDIIMFDVSLLTGAFDEGSPGWGLILKPNPSNTNIEINYTITKSSTVEIVLSDISGNKIEIINKSYKTPGNYSQIYNTSGLIPGIYFVTLTQGSKSISQKLLINR